MIGRVLQLTLAVVLTIVSSAFAGQEHYDYDSLGRLIRFVGSDGRVTEYVYDAVGNILEVKDITGTPGASLVFTSVFPDTVRRKRSVPIVISGSGLRGATVSSPDTTLRVSDLVSSAAQVGFVITVDESAPLGPHNFALSSALGTASFTLTVKPALPQLIATPSPVILSPNGDSVEILLTLGNIDNEDHRIDLAITDPAVASVSVVALEFLSGQTEARVTLTSAGLGHTVVDITSPTLEPIRVGVLVTEVAAGEQFRLTQPVGVLRRVPGGNMGPLLVSPYVRILRAHSTPVSPSGPFTAPPVGVVKGNTVPSYSSGPLLAPPVGVFKEP